MAINLIDILQNQLGDSFAKQAGSFLGESEDNTKKALSGILPALMGSIAKKGADEKGAGAILDMINNNGFDGSMLNNVAGLLSGGDSTNSLLNTGSSILNMLVGDSKLGNVVNMISMFSGMGKGSSKSLISMAAPLLMSVIGKRVKSEGLGAAGLMNLLQGQQGFVQKLLPAGLSSIAGSLGLADMGGKVKDTVGNTAKMVGGAADRVASSASDAAGTAKSGLGRFFPWLLLLGAVLLGLYFLRGCDNQVGDLAGDITESTENMVDKAKEGAGDMVDAAGEVVDGAADVLSDAAKAARDKVAGFTFEVGSFGDRISKYLGGEAEGDGRFAFDNVNFATGSSNITEDSKEQLNQLATMLEAYPKTNIGIEGFTDNTGNPESNVTLSQERANAVMAYLVGQGIAAERMEAKGLGDANPVADNGTEE
ncbi:MAG: OmpA family protein, partial [Bacteroidota bacterium]